MKSLINSQNDFPRILIARSLHGAMGKLHQLDKDVIQQLVAPLSVSGYASAVRELLHNSIDAQATFISVKIHLDSMSVMVTDNGFGINEADLGLVGTQNYTSKAEKDLSSVKTMGFRGEALFAISQVSSTTIVSKVDGFGANTRHLGDPNVDLFEPDAQVCNDIFAIDPTCLGTSWTVVIVRGLFANFKVRRAQLLSQNIQSILSELKNEVAECLLLFPRVKIEVNVVPAEQSIVVSPSMENPLVSTIRSVYGFRALPAYELVNVRYQQYRISGIIGKWSWVSPLNFIFINGRKYIASSQDLKEFNKLVHNLAYVLMVTCPTDEITQDPAKVLYRVHHWKVVKRMILELLGKFGVLDSPMKERSPRKSHLSPRKSLSSPRKSPSKPRSPVKSPTKGLFSSRQLHPNHSISSFKTISAINVDSFRVLKQLDRKYILFVAIVESHLRLFIVDQHACDERIRVESYLKDYIQRTKVNQHQNKAQLSQQLQLELSPTQILHLQLHHAQLQSFGFDIEFRENHAFLLQVPEVLYDKSVSAVSLGIAQYLEHLAANQKSSRIGEPHHWTHAVKDVPQIILDSINMRACRSAIMFGIPLTLAEMNYMLQCLFRCQHPFHCAHGRPSVVEVRASLHPLSP